jgi:hypothetical protein
MYAAPEHPVPTTHTSTMSSPDSNPSGSGLSGSLKVIAGLAILILAGLAALLVTDVVSQEFVKQVMTKVILLCLILAATSVALWVLSRSGRKG